MNDMSPSLSSLDSAACAELEAIVRRFENAWRKVGRPAVADFLPAQGALRKALLIELVHADLEHRIKAEEPARIEDYLCQYPELADDRSVLLDLIDAEFHLRRRKEPDLRLDEYGERFPQCVVGLRDRVKDDVVHANPTPLEPPSAGDDLPIIPGYEVLARIARGGMGTVYRARQPRLDRIVAIKVLAPELANRPVFAERFVREARALARLNHPHINAVHDFGDCGGLYYLALEFVEGTDLRQRLRAGPVAPAEALDMTLQVCDALRYAHEEGIVHRDIKPENILLDSRGRVKVADFGLAKLVSAGDADAALTGSQQVLGTPAYMAPEQWHRPRDVDHRADIYALGVVLHEMLAGELPGGPSLLVSRPAVDSQLVAIVNKMLEREPAQRYPNIETLTGDLGKAAERLRDGANAPAIPHQPAAGISIRFFLGTAMLFLAGWIGTGALANHGLAGLLLAAAGMAALDWLVGRRELAHLPELQSALRKRSRAHAFVNDTLAQTLWLIGFGALIAALYISWDRAVVDPRTFPTTYRNFEHRLLGQLKVYRTRTPPVELVNRGAYVAWEGPQVLWLGLSGSLLIVGAALCRLETPRFRNTWAGHWQPALARSLALLIALPAATTTGTALPFSARFRQMPVRQYALDLEPSKATGRLERWAMEQDYELRAAGSWVLETIPDRQTAAQVSWVEARPSGLFNRWKVTWQGPQRIRPIFKIQFLSGGLPPETIVRIDPGVTRDGLPDQSTASLDRLEAALTGNP